MFALSVRRDERKEIIGSVAKINIGAGIALAAADYEWTLARCILVLGKSPTVILRDKLCSRNTKDDELKKSGRKKSKILCLRCLTMPANVAAISAGN